MGLCRREMGASAMIEEYLSNLTDLQIQERIARLTDFQRKIFLEECMPSRSIRLALFIAISWPDNCKDKGGRIE